MLELTQPDNGMPAGAFYFLDDSIWRSTNGGEYWRLFQTVHNRGSLSTPMRNFPYAPWSLFAKSKPMGANGGFFFQSEVYRRKDGRFLHGARTPQSGTTSVSQTKAGNLHPINQPATNN